MIKFFSDQMANRVNEPLVDLINVQAFIRDPQSCQLAVTHVPYNYFVNQNYESQNGYFIVRTR